jgi:hypothetical protein
MKEEVLKMCIEQGNKYEFLSYDGILDICDEDTELVGFCMEELEKMENEGKINFELDF